MIKNEKKEEIMGGRMMGLRDAGRGRSGSIGVLEMWKRKRNLEEKVEGETGREDDLGELFQRSKKTMRSPVGKEVGKKIEIMG